MAETEDSVNVAEVIEGVNDIAGIADDVLDVECTIGKSIAKCTHRECSVHIPNECTEFDLRNPRVHTDTGRCVDPLPPTIKASSSAEGLFAKTPCTVRGTGGVLTYNLYNIPNNVYTGKIAVVFKVPLDVNLKSNVFAVGVMDMKTKCNNQLFHDMFKNKESTFVRGKANGSSLSFESNTVTIRATMSHSGSAVMKIEVSND